MWSFTICERVPCERSVLTTLTYWVIMTNELEKNSRWTSIALIFTLKVKQINALGLFVAVTADLAIESSWRLTA